jgi:hypothetical protein
MTKSSKKGTNVTLLKKNLNAMIRNIKIHNIFYIIQISKYVEHIKGQAHPWVIPLRMPHLDFLGPIEL